MSTVYPGAIDTLTNPLATDPQNAPLHSAQHANANDAIEAIEGALGVNPQGGSATVVARLGALDATVAGKETAGVAATLDAAHVAAADPHTQYQRESEKAAANGYASLDGTTKVPIAQLPTGATASTVAIGNDSRLSDSRPPSGAAGGDLAGTFPSPTIATAAVTNAKLANSPASTLKGNNTGAPAAPTDLTAAQVKALLAVAATDVSGLAAIAASGSATDLAAGTVPAARMPAHTGDATSPAGSVALTLASTAVTPGSYTNTNLTVDAKGRITAASNGAGGGGLADGDYGDVIVSAAGTAMTVDAGVVTNAKLANAAANTLKGNNTGSAAAPVDMTVAQAKALLALSSTDLSNDAAIEKVANKNIANGYAGLDANTFVSLLWLSAELLRVFGDGSDGNVTISSGNTTLTRDMYYQDLTISGTGRLLTAGFRVFVRGTLTITSTSTPCIEHSLVTAGVGGAGVTAGTAGAAGTALAAATVGGSGAGTIGGVGTATGGGASTAASALTPGNGSAAGAGGTGGLGSSGGGGAGGAGGTTTLSQSVRRIAVDLLRGIQLLGGGAGARGGGGGGGDGTSGAGGGGGGAGGAVIAIFARALALAGATAPIIAAQGRAGGGGGGAIAGNRGGGGAGGGGGGGWVYLVLGSAPTGSLANALNAIGGAGGAGGAGFGTGVGGNGGGGGTGGRITVVRADLGSSTDLVGAAGVAGGTASGVTGGSSGAGGAAQVSL